MWTLIYIIILIQTTNIFVAGTTTEQILPTAGTELPACKDVILTGASGTLTFPATQGGAYQHNLDCDWTINGTLGKIIILEFTQFNLENHTQCSYDFLQIYDSPAASHPYFGKFCGTALPLGGTIYSTTNEIYLSFHSDSSFAYDGFTLNWRSALPGTAPTEQILTTAGTELPACKDVILTGAIGTLTFPATQGGAYQHNLDCDWTINGTLGKIIILKFIHFHMEYQSQCSYDFLQIYDGPSASHGYLGTFCGTGLPQGGTIIGTTHEMHLSFKSDFSFAYEGFSLIWRSVLPDCEGVLTGENGTLTFPATQGGTYSNNVDCGWNIRGTFGMIIILEFTQFNVEPHARCNYDFLQIYDGPSASHHRIGKYCGTTLPNDGTVNSTTHEMFLSFHSDELIGHDGFTLTWRSALPVCGGVISGSNHGIINSPGYPGNYPDNRDCVWRISVNPGNTIVLAFADLDIESHTTCSFDHLTIRDGSSNTSRLLGTFCNSSILPASLMTTSPHGYILFHSDHSIGGRGFQLTYTEVSGRCGGYYTSMSDSFSSPNYPLPYPHHSRCNYTIMVPEGYSITLTFTDFHVEADFDFVWVKENEVTLFKGNGSKENIPSINSSGNALFVYFTSNGSVSESGFSATYYTNRVVNGGWSSWLNWNSCYVSCGGGISHRTRNCNNPSPSNGGTRCFGGSVESRVCNTNCCPVNGNWSMWSIWENCSVTCGFGMQKRTRACDNPYPVFDGINCTGNDLQTQNCSKTPCPGLGDRNTQSYSSGVVGGVAVASIICTSVLCLIVLFTIQRLRQNKGRREDRVPIFEEGVNYVEFEHRMTSHIDDNAECIRPDKSQGDVCGNTERPESNE